MRAVCPSGTVNESILKLNSFKKQLIIFCQDCSDICKISNRLLIGRLLIFLVSLNIWLRLYRCLHPIFRWLSVAKLVLCLYKGSSKTFATSDDEKKDGLNCTPIVVNDYTEKAEYNCLECKSETNDLNIAISNTGKPIPSSLQILDAKIFLSALTLVLQYIQRWAAATTKVRKMVSKVDTKQKRQRLLQNNLTKSLMQNPSDNTLPLYHVAPARYFRNYRCSRHHFISLA